MRTYKATAGPIMTTRGSHYNADETMAVSEPY